MATRDVTTVDMGSHVIYTWADLDSGDDGEPAYVGGFKNLVFQIIGGTNVDLQGSNDGGTNWTPLPDAAGNALTDVVPSFAETPFAPGLVRPNGVTGNNMKIVLFANRVHF